MNDPTPIIDTDWIDFLRTGTPKGFLSRISRTQEEYRNLLLSLLPEKSQSDLEQDRLDFLQDQEKMRQDNRKKEVLEFAKWSMYGNYEQIFLYRLYGRKLVQDAWDALGEAVSRLSDEEKEIAIEHCRSMCLAVEKQYPNAEMYIGAYDFFKDFDFHSGIPSIPSQYVPDEPLIKKRIIRGGTVFFVEGTNC